MTGVGIALVFLMMVAVPASAIGATDLYVAETGSDDNDGTRAAPFRSISRAAEEVQPGTTVHVGPGIYAEGITTKTDGRPDAPIRYVSTVRWGAKIVPPKDSTTKLAWENTGDHVWIDGFEVDGTLHRSGIRWRFGLYTAGTGSVIANSRVHDIGRHPEALSDSNGGAGIEGDGYYGDTDIHLVGNVVHNIGPAVGNGHFLHGIYLTTTGSVRNNLVYQVSNAAIHLWHDARDATIANNTVFASDTGIYVGGGDYVTTRGPNDRTAVLNNIVYDNRYGIMEGGDTGPNNSFTSNLVYKNGKDWRLKIGRRPTMTIAADPRFIHYDRSGRGDYRLSPDSPAVKAGVGVDDPAALPRLRDCARDLGALVFSSPDRFPESGCTGRTEDGRRS